MTYDEREAERQKILEKKARGEKLTQDETRLANLNMIKPGEVRNPKGHPKGVKNWSTHFKKLMGDEKLLKSVISAKPREWDGIVDDVPFDVIAAGLIATITRQVAEAVAQGKALDRNTLKAIELLNKLSFWDKLVIDTEDSSVFSQPVINFVVRDDRKSSSESSLDQV